LNVKRSEASAETLADRMISRVYLSRNEYAKVAIEKIVRQSAVALGLGQSQSQSDVDKN
jgi:phosphoheptose isomerase